MGLVQTGRLRVQSQREFGSWPAPFAPHNAERRRHPKRIECKLRTEIDISSFCASVEVLQVLDLMQTIMELVFSARGLATLAAYLVKWEKYIRKKHIVLGAAVQRTLP